MRLRTRGLPFSLAILCTLLLSPLTALHPSIAGANSGGPGGHAAISTVTRMRSALSSASARRDAAAANILHTGLPNRY